jgi:hypothetical protein
MLVPAPRKRLLEDRTEGGIGAHAVIKRVDELADVGLIRCRVPRRSSHGGESWIHAVTRDELKCAKECEK